MIFRVAVPVPLNRLFDYLAPENCVLQDIKPGIRVSVPFSKGEKIAYLVELSDTSTLAIDSLKTVTRIIDEAPLLQSIDMALLHWASSYYHHPLGEVINTAFPVLLRKGNAATIRQEIYYRVTEQGRTIDLTRLKRAAKQCELLKMFRDHAQPSHMVPARQLIEWDKNWRPPLKSLIKKGLLEAYSDQSAIVGNTGTNKQREITPNKEQQFAIAAVCSDLDKFSVFLLEGVTGSGKTEVYMQIISRVLERGLQILVLLPEITLTPQLEMRFRNRFTVPVSVFHSGLTDTQRQQAWLMMQQGQCSILLGTRSALFTPLARPGLIILDEEHDSSFKQQEGFRFSARDVAVVRGKYLNIPVIMGSATPSLESMHNVIRKRYRHLVLQQRAGGANKPVLKLMDIRNRKMHEGLSDHLVTTIKKVLAKNEQVLIFINRRGFAPTLICHSCGWVARCLRCDANLVIHYHENLLRCHHCGHEQALDKSCPACHSSELTPLGLGTERVEKALSTLFPGERIIRLDRDTTARKGSLEKMLTEINQGSANIILGTQMLAKGHHFPNVTLVAILDVDSGLFSIDFHAPEKLTQMIVQVSGRAGRAEKPGKVILQTRQPEHPLLTTLIEQGYERFAESELAIRKAAGLPPFTNLALLRVQAIDQQAPLIFLQQIRTLLKTKKFIGTEIMGPVASPMARRAGRYRYQMLFQSHKRKDLHDLLDWLIPKIEKLKESRKVRWSVDVDPVDLY